MFGLSGLEFSKSYAEPQISWKRPKGHHKKKKKKREERGLGKTILYPIPTSPKHCLFKRFCVGASTKTCI